MSEPEKEHPRDLLGSGSVRVWWFPAPREGEIVPDYPPVELTDQIISIDVEPAEPDDADRALVARLLEPPPTDELVLTTAARRTCFTCERCTWNPGPDCGRREHPHCPACGHCEGRHAGEAKG